MSYHRDTENALSRIEDALLDAQNSLSCISDVDTPDDIEDVVGKLSDTLREVRDAAYDLLTTDVEDIELAIHNLVDELGEAATDASTLYMRL